ncbi:MAG TPA: ABC transporter ATP-binding protein [Candidatus Limnocylindria bacterium]|nr:ABC transporter ATP-binding protein [Candidatus Limnocylindria bacterium]
MAERTPAWRFLLRAIREQRDGVTRAVVSGMTWQAAAVAAPLFVKEAIDQGVVHGDRTALYAWGGAILGVGAVEAAGGAFRHYYAIRNRARGDAYVRDQIYGHALELDVAYHDRVGAGDLMSRASNDSELIARVLDAAGHTIGYVVTIIAVAIVLPILDWRLALVVLLPLPLLSIGFWRYSARYAERTRVLQEELAVATALAEETVTGIRVVKGLGAGPELSRRFRAASDRIVDRALAVADVDALFLPAMEALPLVGTLAVLWYGARLTVSHELTIGTFTAFSLYVGMLVWPLRTLGQRIGTVQRAVAASARVAEVRDARPRVVDAVSPRGLPPGGADVSFDHVRFGYDPERPVLDGLDLEIPAGTSLALVGATGSGKSTAAALLARFYDVQSGAVRVGGVDVRELPLAELRRAVAFVPETTFLFSDTVFANVAFARPDATRDDVEHAAKVAGAHEFVLRLPEGYETVLGERGFSLSGGQRQRLALARAILADPLVLVLDDATSSVDATKEHEIRVALATVMAGRTTLVIAHRPATIALADRVAVLENGRVAEQGTHTELLARSARYRRLLAFEEAA